MDLQKLRVVGGFDVARCRLPLGREGGTQIMLLRGVLYCSDAIIIGADLPLYVCMASVAERARA